MKIFLLRLLPFGYNGGGLLFVACGCEPLAMFYRGLLFS